MPGRNDVKGEKNKRQELPAGHIIWKAADRDVPAVFPDDDVL